jgi:cellulose biosynthesis protein BcsQ
VTSRLASRVVARFLQKLVRELARPVNKLKGISKPTTKDEGKPQSKADDAVEPHRRDVQPSDVFNPPLPKNVAVREFAETGKDLSKALEKQIPKDKGHETVHNLSQYLIRTEGGGEGGPTGKNL